MKRIKQTLSLVLASILVAGTIAGCTPTNTATTAGSSATTAQTTAAGTTSGGAKEITFKPGTYEGEADGFHGKVKATVTLSDKAVTDIKIEQNETPGVGDKAIETIIAAVKSGSTLNVDAVSGATFSSKGVMAALEAAFTKAGADINALKSKAKAEVKKNDIEETADVIIIGAGGAGLAAAVQAHQDGASVIVVEKMPRAGGNTIISGAAYNAADQEMQKILQMTDLEKATVEKIIAEDQTDAIVKGWQEKLKGEWEAYKASGATYLFDSPSLHKLQTYNGGDKKGNPALIDELGEGASAALPWLNQLGMKFKEHIFTVLGGLWNRAHKPEKPLGTGYIEAYMDYMTKNNIKLYLDTKADELIMKDGRVTGVKATGKEGMVTLHANKGVIIASGGFGANNDMVEKYQKTWKSLKGIKTTNQTGATGDGIDMALKANASLTGMEYVQLLPMGDPKTGSLSGNIEQGVQDRIFVNKEGDRFVDEGARRDVMTSALMDQTDAMMWVIVDKHSYATGDVLNNFNESIDSLVAEGRAFKADTLEELAKKIGVDPVKFIASVETFNKSVDGAADPFGRTLFANKIDSAPFYAGARVPTIHHTMGGITINTDAQVIDANGNVIKGLYAAGEVTGGIHGSNRLGGNALADIVTFGRIAGKSAAQGK